MAKKQQAYEQWPSDGFMSEILGMGSVMVGFPACVLLAVWLGWI